MIVPIVFISVDLILCLAVLCGLKSGWFFSYNNSADVIPSFLNGCIALGILGAIFIVWNIIFITVMMII